MTVDLTPDPAVAELAARTAEFVRTVVLPVEQRVGGIVHSGGPVRQELQDAAREAGLLSPQVSPSYGGHGLDARGQALVFEQAGYALLGPLAMNCAAPDEGNMHLLEVVADDMQRERFLRPLAEGRVRSCFAMTEPAPGAGSDPRALATTATKVPGGWSITGHKWFISGARGAAFSICMARTSGSPGDAGGATMFLLDMDTPGVTYVRDIDTMDQGIFAGHSELRFDGAFVPDDCILGEVDKGFEYAQVRLAPARLTHCMRWLGAASHAHDLAMRHATNRRAFGSRLADLGMAQQHLADNEIDLETSRAMVMRCAWELDQDSNSAESARLSSIAKVFVSEAVNRVVDRSLQLCGALGASEDILVARYLRDARAFRIYDGSSETHRWALARRAVRRATRQQESAG